MKEGYVARVELEEDAFNSLMNRDLRRPENSAQDSEGISTKRPCGASKSSVSSTKSCFKWGKCLLIACNAA
jgi:hypothetical protein